jgi:hypothetical protein
VLARLTCKGARFPDGERATAQRLFDVIGERLAPAAVWHFSCW